MAKAQNRKKRLKSRAGRPRKEGVLRTPTGQPSRSREQLDRNAKEIKETAVQARIRLAAADGEVIAEKEAENPLRGYVAGRKALAGDLGPVKGEKLSAVAASRLQTGNDIAADWCRCHVACGFPPMNAPAMNFSKVRGKPIEGRDAQERARSAETRIMQYIGILGTVHPGAHSIFRRVFLADEERTEEFTPFMNDLLVKSLDALAKG